MDFSSANQGGELLDRFLKDPAGMVSTAYVLSMGENGLESFRRSGESEITFFLKELIVSGLAQQVFDPIKISPADHIEFAMQIRRWEADIAIFHVDGTATIIEVKDGGQGVRSVLGGIGQVGFYAAIVGMTKSLREIRRALLWTHIDGDGSENQLVFEAAKSAGVVPLYMPTVKQMRQHAMLTAADVLIKAAGRSDS